MPLLNYTSKVPLFRTIDDIHRTLVKARAQAIMSEYDAAGHVTAISFKCPTAHGLMAFRLPCDVQRVSAVLNRAVKAREVPQRLLNDADYARRIGWRIIKDWVEAQLALIETEMATVDQVFLPYAYTPSGETVYQHMLATNFSALQLEAPKP